VHVEPLPVLDDLMEKNILLLGLLYPAGDFRELRFARGVVTAFSGDHLVDAVRFDVADADGLEDAEPSDGISQFLLRVGVETASRLVGVGADALAGDGKCAAQTVTAFERGGSGRLFRSWQRGRRREGLAGFRESGFDQLRRYGVRLRRRVPGRRSLHCWPERGG
jgi:hypothetical protein